MKGGGRHCQIIQDPTHRRAIEEERRDINYIYMIGLENKACNLYDGYEWFCNLLKLDFQTTFQSL